MMGRSLTTGEETRMLVSTMVKNSVFTLLVVLLIMTAQSSVRAQGIEWSTVIFRGDRQTLWDCVLLNDSTLLAVGDNGVIRRGTLGKALPTIVGSFGSPSLKAVARGDDRRILACGDDGSVAHSSDDGITWSSRTTDCGTIHDVVHTATHGFIVAADRGVFQFAADLTVRRIGDFPSNSVVALDDTIWASSSTGIVNYTVNSGLEWLEDTSVSGRGPIRALRASPRGDLFLIKDRHLILRPRDGGKLDTLYPTTSSFRFRDIAFRGDTVFATSDDVDGVFGHAFSADYGRSWNVALTFYLRAVNAIATYGPSLACVGQSGAFVFNNVGSTINASFSLMGFQPQIVAPEAPSIAALSVDGASFYALTSSPTIALLRSDDSLRSESVLGMTLGLTSMNMAVANGHVWIVYDSTRSIPIPGGTRQSRRFNVMHKRLDDSTWEKAEGDMWDTPSSSIATTPDGALLLCSAGMNYLIRIRQHGVKDTISEIPSSTVDYVCSNTTEVYVVVDQQRLYSSGTSGATWQLRSSLLPFKPHAIQSQSAGRVVISRLDVSGPQRMLRLARSTDTGVTWVEYPPTLVVGVLTSVTRMRSRGNDDLLISGRGNTVMVSRDGGSTLQELLVPASNTITITDACFLDDRTIVVGGTQSTFMIGRFSPSTTVTDPHSNGIIELLELPMREVRVYDYLGRIRMSRAIETGSGDLGRILDAIRQSDQMSIVELIMADGERRFVKLMR